MTSPTEVSPLSRVSMSTRRRWAECPTSAATNCASAMEWMRAKSRSRICGCKARRLRMSSADLEAVMVAGRLFCEDELVLSGQPQPVGLAPMQDDHLRAPSQNVVTENDFFCDRFW